MPNTPITFEQLHELYRQANRDKMVLETRCNVRQKMIDERDAEIKRLKVQIEQMSGHGVSEN